MNEFLKYTRNDLLAVANNFLKENIDFDEEQTINLIMLFTMNEIDYKLSILLCEKAISSKDYWIKNMAVLGASHIARVYKKGVSEQIYNELKKIISNTEDPFYENAKTALFDLSVIRPKNKDLRTKHINTIHQIKS